MSPVLPGPVLSPSYVKSYLLPDKLSKRKTAVKKRNLNPVFNEILQVRLWRWMAQLPPHMHSPHDWTRRPQLAGALWQGQLESGRCRPILLANSPEG